MTSEREQPELWAIEPTGEMRDALERERERWTALRRRVAIGSPQEVEAWQAYRSVSDRYWYHVRQMKGD